MSRADTTAALPLLSPNPCGSIETSPPYFWCIVRRCRPTTNPHELLGLKVMLKLEHSERMFQPLQRMFPPEPIPLQGCGWCPRTALPGEVALIRSASWTDHFLMQPSLANKYAACGFGSGFSLSRLLFGFGPQASALSGLPPVRDACEIEHLCNARFRRYECLPILQTPYIVRLNGNVKTKTFSVNVPTATANVPTGTYLPFWQKKPLRFYPCFSVPSVVKFFSGRSKGNRITSRMVCESVSSMHSRSTPTPTPPVGGIP